MTLLVQISDTHIVERGKLLYGMADTALHLADTVAEINAMRPRPDAVLVTDDLLRGIDNKSLVHVVRELAPGAVIIANAIDIEQIHQVYDAGADYVYLNRFEAAWTLQRAINAGLEREIDDFRTRRQSRNHYKPDRKEILS